MRYDYKTVAAPRRPGKFKGAKGADAFARTLEEAISAEASAGWEYLRAENLPCEEKPGFFSRRHTIFHSVLIFRREKGIARMAPVEEEEEPALARRACPDPEAPRFRDEPASQPAADRSEPLLRLDPAMQTQEREDDAPRGLGPAR